MMYDYPTFSPELVANDKITADEQVARAQTFAAELQRRWATGDRDDRYEVSMRAQNAFCARGFLRYIYPEVRENERFAEALEIIRAARGWWDSLRESELRADGVAAMRNANEWAREDALSDKKRQWEESAAEHRRLTNERG